MTLMTEIPTSDFLRDIVPTLEKDFGVHSFLISLARTCAERERPPAKVLKALNRDGSLAVAAIQSDLHFPLVISRAGEMESSQFARLLAAKYPGLTGVNGPAPGADAFAKAWSNERGCNSRLIMNLRLFELKTLIPQQRRPSGSFRLASVQDEPLVSKWLNEFRAEAVPQDPKPTPETMTKSNLEAISKSQIFLWEDKGKCVCLVASRRETARDRWIAPVYTPPAFRGHGYATALVAEVSRRVLSSGKSVMLFTDLANPTSNSIYQKIGYKILADFKYFAFEQKN